MQTVSLMAEGNKSAHKLLLLCARVDPLLLLHLDDMNMRGEQAWVSFYWYCEGIFEKFKLCVTTRDSELVNFVNKHPSYPRAVTRGGAPR